MSFSKAFGGAGRALATPLFRRYWTGHTLATIGRWMKRTAVGWLAWELTESPAWLGIVTFADLLPTVLLAVLAGAISDRFGFMRIIRLSQIAAAILSAVFATLILTGAINIYAVTVLAFVFGAVESMGQPARMSAVHALVARRDLSSAIALGSASFNASRIVGPGIAGFLIVWTNTGVVIGLCAFSFLSFYLILRTLDFGEPNAGGTRSPAALLGDIRSGIVYAFTHTGLRFVFLLLAATSFFIRPVIELMPGISARVFAAGPTGLSLLLAAIGAGALTASLWLARRGEMRGLTGLLIGSTIVTGVALMLAMQFRNIWLAAAFLCVMGAAMLTGNVSAQTLVQNSVEAQMRARVMSLFIVFAYGLPAIGAVLMGWIATWAGLQATIAGGALFMFLFWAWGRPQKTAMSHALEQEGPEERSAAAGLEK
ncbi:MAG: MFS transporter [Beijerinckiaceae bacterium]